MRKRRFIPESDDGILVEVSCRTIGGLALLRPSRKLPEVIAGVLGRAIEVSPLQIAALFFASNHWHGLLITDDQQSLSRFMMHVQANLAKEAGRLVDWQGKVWSREYDGIVVSREPEAQWARLKYVLAGGVKEGLVESQLEWPGLHCARALMTGEPIVGHLPDVNYICASCCLTVPCYPRIDVVATLKTAIQRLPVWLTA